MMIIAAKNAESKAKAGQRDNRERSNQPSCKMGIYNLHRLAIPDILNISHTMQY
jgi:hypothetical protein